MVSVKSWPSLGVPHIVVHTCIFRLCHLKVSLCHAVAVLEMWAPVRIFFLENCCRQTGGKCCQSCFCPSHCSCCSEHLHHTGLEIQDAVFFLYYYFCVFLCIFHRKSRGSKLIMPYVFVCFFLHRPAAHKHITCNAHTVN